MSAYLVVYDAYSLADCLGFNSCNLQFYPDFPADACRAGFFLLRLPTLPSF
jgi:hypothetical protein